MLKLPTMYFVTTDYGDAGVAFCGDFNTTFDAAYDKFAECLHDGQPARGFMVQFDVDTNAPEAITEITEELATEYALICGKRELPAADVFLNDHAALSEQYGLFAAE